MLPHPEIDSWFLFALQIILAFYAMIAVHELGHWLVGKLVGLRIATCGLGLGKPYFHFRVFGTTFYLARQRRAGLTVYLTESLAPHRGKMSAFIIGGTGANLVAAALIFAVWQLGWKSNFLVALFYWSIWGILNFIPYRINLKNGATFQSDGMVLLKLLTGQSPTPLDYSSMYATAKILRELSRQLDAYDATIHWSLMAAQSASALGLFDEAEANLADPSLADPRRGNLADWQEAISKVAVAVVKDPEAALAEIENAKQVCADRPDALALLHVYRAGLAIDLNESPKEWIQEARGKIESNSLADFQVALDVYELMAGVPTDIVAACRSLVDRRGRNELSSFLKLAVLSHTVKVLMDQGEQSKARPLFTEANRTVLEIVKSLTPEERNRSLAHLTRTLRNALSNRQIEEPMWISAQGDIEPMRAPINPEMVLTLLFMALATLCFIASLGKLQKHEFAESDAFVFGGMWFCSVGFVMMLWLLIRGRIPRVYSTLLMLVCAGMVFVSGSLHRVVLQEKRIHEEVSESIEEWSHENPLEPSEQPE